MPGIVINDYYRKYECRHCDRAFNSAKALYQHCENTSQHSWCSDCQLTFDTADDLRDHELLDDAHCNCDVCDEVFENAHNLRSHSIVHADADCECVHCTRLFRSNSAMLIHLETGCHTSGWNTRMTQFALSIFTRKNPTYYGIDARQTGPITCGCEGKSFSKVSALCQHLESEACEIDTYGADVVDELVEMMRDGVWAYTRKGNVKSLNFADVVLAWGDRVYR